jgi:putative transposase
MVMQAAKGRLYGGGLVAVARIGGQCRALWNLFVAENTERYNAEGKFVFFHEMSARLPKLLKEDPRLAGLPHRAAQMTVQKLDRALRDCAKRKGTARRGFPRFKKYADRSDAFSFVGREIKLEPGRIRLPKIGWLRVRGITFPDGADLKQVAVTQEPNGWHVSLQFDAPAKVYPTATMPVVGIDVGLNHLATLSNGTRIEHPRLARKAAKRLRLLNRERDRRRKGSVNRKRTVVRLGRAHRALLDARKDAMHKVTRKLVDTYDGFAVEDLSLRGMMRTRMAGSLADAGLGKFFRTLRYKADWAGRSWRVYGRFVRSTGVCPDCGQIGEKLALSVRSWACASCGAVHDRDVAAARVILAGAVLPGGQEPAAAMPRKRGSAVRGGDRASARSSHGGPPPNVAESPSRVAITSCRLPPVLPDGHSNSLVAPRDPARPILPPSGCGKQQQARKE